MKSFILAALIAFSFSAQATIVQKNDAIVAKNPDEVKDDEQRQGGGDQPSSREETYEGNDRNSGSNSSDYGNGYEDRGDGGGMMSEIFSVPKKGIDKENSSTEVEDRGDVLVYTTRSFEAISADEVCFTTSVLVVSKKDGSVVSSETETKCTGLP